jgi:hypothetical protein
MPEFLADAVLFIPGIPGVAVVRHHFRVADAKSALPSANLKTALVYCPLARRNSSSAPMVRLRVAVTLLLPNR